MSKNCLICLKEIILNNYRIGINQWNKRKYCSRRCMGISKKNQVISIEQRKKMSLTKLKNPIRYWLGKKRPELLKTNSSKTMFKKGMSPWCEGKKMSQELREKLSLAHLKGRQKITPEIISLRSSVDYSIWRKTVLKRDNFTCLKCGSKSNLHVDHIKPFAYFPDLRFDIDNGRTLCATCHRKTDTWGGRSYLYG